VNAWGKAMKVRLGSGAVMLLALLAATGCGRDGAPPGGKGLPPVAWKLASMYPATWPVLGEGGTYFAGQVGTSSAGRFTVEFNDPGKLVPEAESFDAVSRGTVDALWSTSQLWAGRMPVAALFSSVPFGPPAQEYLGWLYQGGGLLLWQELYAKYNLRPIPCGLAPSAGGGWFLEDLKRPEQVRGMKIRMDGLGAAVFAKLGATVLQLALEDVSQALEKGVLQGSSASIPALDEKTGLQRVAKHYFFPGWEQRALVLELVVNLDRWKALPAADQQLVEAICRDSIIQTLTSGEGNQVSALARIRAEGVQVHAWPMEFLRAFKRAFDEVVKEQSAKNPDFARVWTSLARYRQIQSEWVRLTAVPELN
jgi:TRAP-type mannitol/chloroaromatic compound transport system substrate-binding protein